MYTVHSAVPNSKVKMNQLARNLHTLALLLSYHHVPESDTHSPSPFLIREPEIGEGGSGSIKRVSLLKKLDASDISATQLRSSSAARRGQWCARVQCLQSSANSGLRDSKFEIRACDDILLRFGSRSMNKTGSTVRWSVRLKRVYYKTIKWTKIEERKKQTLLHVSLLLFEDK